MCLNTAEQKYSIDHKAYMLFQYQIISHFQLQFDFLQQNFSFILDYFNFQDPGNFYSFTFTCIQ